MDVDKKISELAELYRKARASNDSSLLPLAEAAMARFAVAEAATTQMNIQQRLLSAALLNEETK